MFLSQLKRLDIPRAKDLSSSQLFQLMLAYGLISLPLIRLFPMWLTGVVLLTLTLKAVSIAFRLTISKWIALAILIGAIGLVVVNFNQFGKEYAGLALLFVFASLKLLEAKESRDAFLLMLIYCLLIMGALMANKHFFNFIYLVICLLFVVLMQWRIDTPQSARMSWGKQSGALFKLLIISLPFVVGLFYLFPRFQPLWAQPSRPTANTGLSDEMTPNSLTQLVQDGGLAFRVQFDGDAPPANQQYWRGPVLTQFDGKTWRRSRFTTQPPPTLQVNPDSQIRYTMVHDGETNRWLVPLDLPGEIPSGAEMNRQFEMLASRDLVQPKQFPMMSYARYSLTDINAREREFLTQIPQNIYPKTLALARELRQASATSMDFVNATWQYFRDNEFYYDLEPPLGNDDMDRFLFTNRVGYCEHYASVFAFMMRSQGIPTRVVTGYQGSEYNPISKEYEVRQLHAHAWTEVYIDGQGWVRIDPTAAVAPDRISRADIANSVRNSDALSLGDRWQNQSETVKRLGQSLRALNSFWQNWVINYDEDKQNSLWQKLGLEKIKYVVWLFFILVMLPLVGGVLFWLSRLRQQRLKDPVQKMLQPFMQRLAKHGIIKSPSDSLMALVLAHEAELGDCYSAALAVAYSHQQLRYEMNMGTKSVEKASLARLQRHVDDFIQMKMAK